MYMDYYLITGLIHEKLKHNKGKENSESFNTKNVSCPYKKGLHRPLLTCSGITGDDCVLYIQRSMEQGFCL